MSDQSRQVGSLEAALRATGFAWSLCLVGEDQADQLAALTNDLRRPFSSTGHGKRITSGFSYWGAEPTYAWARACADPLYPVMRDSIRSFPSRWREVSTGLSLGPFHYVSLGPGTGQKDRIILASLHPRNSSIRYLPLDMSTEMLQAGSIAVTRDGKFPGLQLLPVQLDFCVRESVHNFRQLLDVLVGEEPVLFSLLGNTLANFDADDALLALLSAGLLNPNDRLLLELASTTEVSVPLANKASDEYRGSSAFCNFVTSALLHRTDLRIDMDSVKFEPALEGDERALVVRTICRNQTGETIRVVLGDRSVLSFPPNDTIRLYLSRKYTTDGAQRLVAEAGLEILDRRRWTYRDSPFGLDLLLLTPRAAARLRQ